MVVHSRSWQRKIGVTTAGAALAVAGVAGVGGVASASQQPPAQPTIVGGEIVDTAPSWAATIGNDEYGPFCSGSLVASQWVLSAKHCTKSITFARIGSKSPNSGGTLVDVEKSAAHPTYDVRLYKLASPVTNEPVKLAQSSPEAGDAITLYGYGQTCDVKDCGDMSKLRYVDSEVVDDSLCGWVINGDGEICVDTRPDNTTCYGDSGGAAIVDGRLAGVTSRPTAAGQPCGAGNTIYGDVSVVSDWIEETITE